MVGAGGVGGEWVTGLGLGFTNSWGKWDMFGESGWAVLVW